MYRRPVTPAEQRRLDELAAGLAASRGAPPPPRVPVVPVVPGREPVRPKPRPAREPAPVRAAEVRPEQPPKGRRHEPQPADFLRLPVCPRCWHLRDSLGHVWTCLYPNGRPRKR